MIILNKTMMVAGLALGLTALEVGAQHTESTTSEAAEGPHGGRLLEAGGLALEVTIYEQGVPPEMRIYPLLNGDPLDPAAVDVSVTLHRLGGERDQIGFSAELDYLVGDQEISEPHSFDVMVEASHRGSRHSWEYENHEGRTEISDRLLELAGVKTEVAAARRMTYTDTLYGVIAAPEDKVYRLNAPYESIVETVHVGVGDIVQAGQRLVTLKNTSTLQSYSLESPASGEVTSRPVNPGDRSDMSYLIEITDLSRVWVELSAFPESIEKLVIGQQAIVYDLHQHEQASGEITYIAPLMTSGHIARARAVIDNPEGHWRPGMHIRADVRVGEKDADLAVRASALQTFRDMPVVFARYGNTFEVRMVELGEASGDYVEVLGGLEPGTEYVTENSFLLKADVLKDGASHDH